jgi:RNA polymerase sigma-70 factor (ECF subfamily)
MASTSPYQEHRAALTGHCYRMLGSAAEAEDAVQEALVRAWKAQEQFEGRASMRTWLYRIATNVCLDAIDDRKRRTRAMDIGPKGGLDSQLTALPDDHWLEPIADHLALPETSDPAERALLRESIRLAFVAALQHLPAKQRAALLLTEVLGWPVAEVAESLDSTVPAINSALQRARATLATRDLLGADKPLSTDQQALVDDFVAAFERYDVEALTQLLHQDATLSMPPYTLWLQGQASIREWMLGPGAPCRGSKLIATAACGLPAFGQYRLQPDGSHEPWALIVLEPVGGKLANLTYFLDAERWFPRFRLPPTPP